MTPTKGQLTRRINRREDAAKADRVAWRSEPATAEQIKALRRIATETGRTFSVRVTRGEAWRRIRSATRLLPPAARNEAAPPWARKKPKREEGAR